MRTTDPSANAAKIIRSHLFGESLIDATAGMTAAPPVNWVLSGIIAGQRPAGGYAIIGESARAARLRAVGDEVSNGFKLVEVLADQVLLERSGERIAVRMPRFRLGGAGETLAAGAPRGDSAPAAAPVVWHPRKGQPSNRPPALVMLQPHARRMEDGRVAMMVMGEGNGSNLAALGLQRGDIITAVDGHPVGSSEVMMQLLKQMSTGCPVMVTVIRQGNEHEMPLALPLSGG
jgi:general secretion pathway protein C